MPSIRVRAAPISSGASFTLATTATTATALLLRPVALLSPLAPLRSPALALGLGFGRSSPSCDRRRLSTTPSSTPSSPRPAPIATAATATTATVADAAAATVAATSAPLNPVARAIRKVTDFAKQYYNGAKQFYSNTQEVRRLFAKKKAAKDYEYTRRELALIRTTEIDAKRMVPFFTVLLILPEALPFLIVSRPDFVPSTCLSSNQIEKMWTGSKEKRLEIAAGFVKSCADGGNFRPEQFGTNDFVRMVAQYQPQHFDWSHLPLDTLRNCSTWVGLKRGSRLVPVGFMLRRRLRQHFDFLGKEDALMKAEGLDAMTDGELRVAAEARGISTIGKDSEAIKVELETWLALTVDPEVKMPGGLMIIASAIRTGMSGSIVERL